MIPFHLGALHPIEQALTVVLAFGPFLVLGAVVFAQRRRDRAAEAEVSDSATDSPPEPGA